MSIPSRYSLLTKILLITKQLERYAWFWGSWYFYKLPKCPPILSGSRVSYKISRSWYRNAMCVAADHFFPGAFHSGQVLQKDLALRSRQHLTYSITIIHRHIPQGVRGPHKLEPTSPQLHSDFTPGWCRSFGQVSLVSRADSHLHSARQSSIIFMLLNQSSCRWVSNMTWSFKYFMLGS